MNLLEICLMILGFGIIIVSFFIVDKGNNSKTDLENKFNQEKIEEVLEEKESQFRDSINKAIKEIMDNNNKELSQLTNEKMLAIQEFSEQVMGGIEDSHEEVLFLYKMLNEKEDSLEDIAQPISTPQEDHTINQQEDILLVSIEEEEKEIKKQFYNKKPLTYYNSLDDEKKSDKYKNIIKLYNQGKSITEISKQLSLGQGEVRLIIDMNKRLVKEE